MSTSSNCTHNYTMSSATLGKEQFAPFISHNQPAVSEARV